MKLQVLLAILLLTTVVFAAENLTPDNMDIEDTMDRLMEDSGDSDAGNIEPATVTTVIENTTTSTTVIATRDVDELETENTSDAGEPEDVEASEPAVGARPIRERLRDMRPERVRECLKEKDELVGKLKELQREKAKALEEGDDEKLRELVQDLAALRLKIRAFNCGEEAKSRAHDIKECVGERMELKEKIARVSAAIQRAEELNDTATAAELRAELSELKEELSSLPPVDECIQKLDREDLSELRSEAREKIRDFLKDVREFRVELDLLNPCESATLIDEKIADLQLEMENATEEEAAAMGDKIAALSGVSSDLKAACAALRNNTACDDAYRLSREIEENVDSIKARVESGELTPLEVAKRAKEIKRRFDRLEDACLDDLKEAMDRHPCVAAEIARASIERASLDENLAEYLPEMQDRLEHFEKECREGAVERRKEMREKFRDARKDLRRKAKEVAQYIGELELKKYAILMDDSLSEAEKKEKIAELEEEKMSLIKESLRTLKRARISTTARLRLAPRTVELDGDVVQEDNVTLEVPTDEGEVVEVQVKDSEVEVKGRKAKVRARAEMEFEDGRLKFRGKAIVLPDRVVERLKAKAAELELEEKDGRPVYRGRVVRRAKLLAFIPVEITGTVEADATEGKVLSQKLPWWAVFATE